MSLTRRYRTSGMAGTRNVRRHFLVSGVSAPQALDARDCADWTPAVPSRPRGWDSRCVAASACPQHGPLAVKRDPAGTWCSRDRPRGRSNLGLASARENQGPLGRWRRRESQRRGNRASADVCADAAASARAPLAVGCRAVELLVLKRLAISRDRSQVSLHPSVGPPPPVRRCADPWGSAIHPSRLVGAAGRARVQQSKFVAPWEARITMIGDPGKSGGA